TTAPPPAAAASPAPTPPPATRVVTLSADALFGFNRSDLGGISPEGRRRLDDLSRELRGVDVQRVRVIGHADRIGSAAYNDRLSQERAASVVRYLVGAGVPSRLVSAEGRGSREPVVQCNQTARAALIECLAPNRRVEIEITGKSGTQ
ncbi:OmpA family protein, partial [Pigmentiphaga soli]|uniref:OmpA family protein n=1 Tax=Pigmentiphaga soli TaxID=1007095 RepID=UPI0031F09D44